jgi:hypothetical protein
MDRLNHINLGWLFLGAVVIGAACFGIGAGIGALLNRARTRRQT